MRHNSFLGIHTRRALARFGFDFITWQTIRRCTTTLVGSEHGGWSIPLPLLKPGSLCYLVGAGEDISCDLELSRLGHAVYIFDPTPRSIRYVEEHTDGKIRFFPVGVWSHNEVKRFYTPKDPAHVSHSILNLQKTEAYFDAPCKKIRTLMEENGHAALDLLKLDIEGAEYEVVDSILRDRIPVRVLCVEFDELRNPLEGHYYGDYLERIRSVAKRLADKGFRLIKADKSNFTFLGPTA